MPGWLRTISKTSNFYKEDIINNSVYYPGAGLDASIIHAYSGFAHSFIYADYGERREDVLKSIVRLAGYDVVLIKELNPQDIFPGAPHDLELNQDDFIQVPDTARILTKS
jgi:hypothetical protein